MSLELSKAFISELAPVVQNCIWTYSVSQNLGEIHTTRNHVESKQWIEGGGTLLSLLLLGICFSSHTLDTCGQQFYPSHLAAEVFSGSLHQRRTWARHCRSEFCYVSKYFWSFLFIPSCVRNRWGCANHQTSKYWKKLPALFKKTTGGRKRVLKSEKEIKQNSSQK